MGRRSVEAQEKATRLLDLADLLRSGHSLAEAVGAYREALKEEAHLPDELAVDIRLRLAYTLLRDGKAAEAKQVTTAVLQRGYPEDLVPAARTRFAEALFTLGDHRRALKEAEQAYRHFVQRDNDKAAEAAQIRGHAHRELGEIREAESAYQEGMTFARLAEGPDRLVRLSLCLAGLLSDQARYQEGIGPMQLALQLCREHGLSELEPMANQGLAVAQFRLGNWDEAENLVLKALELNTALGRPVGRSLAFNLLAQLAHRRGQDPEPFLDECENVAEGVQYRRARLLAREVRAEIELERGRYDKALEILRDLRELTAPDIPDSTIDYEREWRTGLIDLEQGRLEVAEARVAVARQKAEAAGDGRLLAHCQEAQARILHLRGRTLAAQTEIRSALDRFRVAGLRWELMNAYGTAASILDGAEAAYCRAQVHALRESLGLGVSSPTPSGPTPSGPTPSGLAPDPSLRRVAGAPFPPRLIGMARELSSFTGTILLVGETGVGKTALARVIHAAGPRSTSPLQHLECIGWSARRAESGADPDPVACFREHLEGTILVKHVDRACPELQARLVAAIDETNQEDPMANQSSRPRLIMTAGQDPGPLVDQGLFLQELYFRVIGYILDVPSLRDRPDDIRALAQEFAGGAITDRARDVLMDHSWPGNVRDLKNAVEEARVRAGNGVVEPMHLPARVRPGSATAAGPEEEPLPTLPDEIEELEKFRIRQALERTDNNKRAAAIALGVSRKGLIDRLKRLGMWAEFGRTE